MLAIFKTGGKQYSVKAGQILKVEKLEGNEGDNVSFNDILAVSDNSDHTIGNPLVKGATIEAKILEQIRDKKIIVFKKRRRQNYRHTQGHRQYLTVLKIESIAIGDKKSLAPKKIDKAGHDIATTKTATTKTATTKTATTKTATTKTATTKTATTKTAIKKKVAAKKTATKK